MTEIKDKKFLVVGFGAMGCRHTQSLLDSGYKNVCVVEPEIYNLENGLNKIGYTKDDIQTFSHLEKINNKYDFAIIATAATPRFSIMEKLIYMGINYFLVEKIVFQSLHQFDIIINLLEKSNSEAYCNFVNRYVPNYQKIRDSLNNVSGKIKFNIKAGDLGFACSSIHYLDLFEFLTNSTIKKSDSMLSVWNRENKRGANYKEFSGIFYAENEKCDTLEIYFDPSHKGLVTLDIEEQDKSHTISEGSGVEYIKNFSDKLLVSEFKILPSSKLTSTLVHDIFHKSTFLPSISEIKNAHLHLFKECNRTLNIEFTKDNLCPIT